MTLLLEGHSKQQTRSHPNGDTNATLDSQSKHIRQTFAQGIEEKYFQTPSTTNEATETKSSTRRGSLRAFQVCILFVSVVMIRYQNLCHCLKIVFSNIEFDVVLL